MGTWKDGGGAVNGIEEGWGGANLAPAGPAKKWLYHLLFLFSHTSSSSQILDSLRRRGAEAQAAWRCALLLEPQGLSAQFKSLGFPPSPRPCLSLRPASAAQEQGSHRRPCPFLCSLPQTQLKQKQGEITALESLQLVKTLVRVVSGLCSGPGRPRGLSGAASCCRRRRRRAAGLPQSVYHVSFLRGLFPDGSFKGVDMQNLDGGRWAGRGEWRARGARQRSGGRCGRVPLPRMLHEVPPRRHAQGSTSRCWMPRRPARRSGG